MFDWTPWHHKIMFPFWYHACDTIHGHAILILHMYDSSMNQALYLANDMENSTNSGDSSMEVVCSGILPHEVSIATSFRTMEQTEMIPRLLQMIVQIAALTKFYSASSETTMLLRWRFVSWGFERSGKSLFFTVEKFLFFEASRNAETWHFWKSLSFETS